MQIRDSMTTPEQLEAALAAGGPECVQALAGLNEQQRRSLAPTASRWMKLLDRADYNAPVEGVPYQLLRVTTALAMTGTATFTELKKHRLLLQSDELALQILRERPGSWIQRWADWTLADVPWRWLDVRALMKAGLISRPPTEIYILGMIAGQHGVKAIEAIRRDPQLLEEIPHFFEVEGNRGVSLAAHDKYCCAEGGWSHALLTLAEEGQLCRADLMRWSLEALGRGFPSFRAGWYSRFYKACKPSPQEMVEHAPIFLELLRSEVSSTVSFGIGYVSKANKVQPLPDEQLIAGLEPIWQSSKKGVVRSGLKLLAKTSDKQAWMEPLSQALLHPEADIASEVFELMQQAFPRPPDPWRERLQELSSYLPPRLKSAWGQWLGIELEQEEAPVVMESAGGVGEPVTPLGSHREVCELAAQLLEELGDGLDVERLLDGMLRFRQESSPYYSSLAKRCHTRLVEWDLRSCLAAVILSWLGDPTGWEPVWAEQWNEERGLGTFLVARLGELHIRLQNPAPTRLLSLPTDSTGELELDALLARLSQESEVLEWDFAQALLRLPAGTTPPQGNSVYEKVLAYALEEQVKRFPETCQTWKAAADEYRARSEGDHWALSVEVRSFDSYGKTYTHRYVNPAEPPSKYLLNWHAQGDPTCERRWYSLICPARHQRWFMLASLNLAANLDWWGAEWGDQVFLETLFQRENWGRWGRVTAAFGLGCKEPTQRSLAVDAVAEALSCERLSGADLGAALRETAATGVIKGNRWKKSFSELRGFAPNEPLMEALEILYDSPPEDFKGNPLLSEFYDLACVLQRGPTREGCRHWLEAFKGKGKAAQLAKKLLKLG